MHSGLTRSLSPLNTSTQYLESSFAQTLVTVTPFHVGLLVQNLQRCLQQPTVEAAAGQLRWLHLCGKLVFPFCYERLENFQLYAALLLAMRMQGLTRGADCFVLCLCDVQRDTLFSFGKGRWE